MSMAGASVGLMGAGTGLSALSDIMAGLNSQKVAKYNAQVARQQAAQATERGMQEEQAFRMKVRGLMGAQRVAYASQGVDVNKGTPAEAQAQAAHQGELDALQIRANAAMEAWGYQVQAAGYMNQGRLAMNAAVSNAAGSLATGGARTLAMYDSLDRRGAFSGGSSAGSSTGPAGYSRMSGNFNSERNA